MVVYQTSNKQTYAGSSQRSREITLAGNTRGLVIAVLTTGFGTKGQKWDALILVAGQLITIKDAWMLEGYHNVIT